MRQKLPQVTREVSALGLSGSRGRKIIRKGITGETGGSGGSDEGGARGERDMIGVEKRASEVGESDSAITQDMIEFGRHFHHQ